VTTPKLDGTDNLIDLYMAYAGQSEVPPQFHLWCCLSVIASAVSNKVWLEKMPGKKLTPNLYVALIGPSAIGKGEAIDAMLNVVRDQPKINFYRGKVTAPGLLDVLAMPGKNGRPSWAHLLLVTPELSWSIGRGEWADGLVKQLTELYGGSIDPVREYTRTRGTTLRITDLCINWIAGTTREWLLSSIPPDSISGGFFGRMVAVPADYNFDLRYYRPIVSADWEVILALLRARVAVLSSLAGAFGMTADALANEQKWYEERPAPTDPDLQAAYKRQHDLMLKLAMILSLADGPSLTINSSIIAKAQKLSDSVVRKMPNLISFGAMTPETRGLGVAEDFLRRCAGPVPHSMLLKRMSNRGYDADSVRKVMQTLVEMGKVTRTGFGKGMFYEWNADGKKSG